MAKEYFILATDKQDVMEAITGMGIKHAKIKSGLRENLAYYFLDIPSEKAKELYDKGADFVGKISELPGVFYSFRERSADALSAFKAKFGDTLDSLLTREELPTVQAVRHRTLLCSAGYGYSLEDLSKRDSFIAKVYTALSDLAVSKA